MVKLLTETSTVLSLAILVAYKPTIVFTWLECLSKFQKVDGNQPYDQLLLITFIIGQTIIWHLWRDHDCWSEGCVKLFLGSMYVCVSGEFRVLVSTELHHSKHCEKAELKFNGMPWKSMKRRFNTNCHRSLPWNFQELRLTWSEGYRTYFLRSLILFNYSWITKKEHCLPVTCHIHIWQVSPKLSCSDNCPAWMWFKNPDRYFRKSEMGLAEKYQIEA